MFLFYLLIFVKETNIFDPFFSDDDDNDEFTLGNAVLFAWKKRKNRLQHAYAVTAWALSLLPDIRADCMERLSTDNGDLRKLIDDIVLWLRYPPCSNKKVASKSMMKLLKFFGKNSNTLLSELALQLSIRLL